MNMEKKKRLWPLFRMRVIYSEQYSMQAAQCESTQLHTDNEKVSFVFLVTVTRLPPDICIKVKSSSHNPITFSPLQPLEMNGSAINKLVWSGHIPLKFLPVFCFHSHSSERSSSVGGSMITCSHPPELDALWYRPWTGTTAWRGSGGLRKTRAKKAEEMWAGPSRSRAESRSTCRVQTCLLIRHFDFLLFPYHTAGVNSKLV